MSDIEVCAVEVGRSPHGVLHWIFEAMKGTSMLIGYSEFIAAFCSGRFWKGYISQRVSSCFMCLG
jgi:hypothetical protein